MRLYSFVVTAFLFATCLVHGADQFEYNKNQPRSPEELQPPPRPDDMPPTEAFSPGDDDVLIPDLKGIIIVDTNQVPEQMVADTKGVKFHFETPKKYVPLTANQQRVIAKQLRQNYIGKPLTMRKIKKMKREIIDRYVEFKHPFIIMQLPPQGLDSGVLTIAVIESRVGKVEIKGANWFSEQYYREWMTLYESDPINSTVLNDDLYWLNRNPFHRGDIVFRPGAKPYTTDVEVIVQDFRPFKVYAGVDNTGIEAIDRTRVFAGFNWGNVWKKGQIFSAQYTAAPDFKKYQSITANYLIPLPWKNLIDFYGGYSSIKLNASDIPGHVKHGQSWQFSSRYTWPIPVRETFVQEGKLGFDFKRTDDDILFNQVSILDNYANVFQVVGEYNFSMRWEGQMLSFDGKGFFSPGEISTSMSRESLAKFRPGAQNVYLYGFMTCNYLRSFSQDWLFNFKTTAQFSTGALFPSEMLGLGGYYSIRGYTDHVINVDNGFIFNTEFRSPRFSLMKHVSGKPNWSGDTWSAVGFFDLGFGWEDKQVGNNDWSFFLAGVGPGLRLGIGEWLNARLDWAWRLNRIPFDDKSNRWYFSVTADY
ncbi:MAG: hypothetical protein S4CHLAM102_03250 [Chlamydiia bacterium]|nr:hypothetical protein [Chlamydiia bacterium]